MSFNLRTGARTLGLAALIGAAPMALAAEEGAPGAAMAAPAPLSVSWEQATKIKGGANQVSLSIGARVDANFFYHDLDKAWSNDSVLRQVAVLNAALPNPVTSTAIQTYLGTAGGTWAAAQRNFADGVLLDDAEIGIKGEAYGCIIFGLQYDGAEQSTTDDTVELDKWYVGIKGIPGIGELTIREVDNTQGLVNEQFMDEDIATLAFELHDLVGFQATNTFVDGRLGYCLAVGVQAGEQGNTNSNWDIQAALWGDPIVRDDLSLRLKLDVEFHNPSPSAHTAFSDVWSVTGSLENGPALINFRAASEDVRLITASASFLRGNLFIGGNYTIADSDKAEGDLFTAEFIRILTTGASTGTVSEYYDTRLTGFVLAAAYSLTGEKQINGGGIKAPEKNFSWENPAENYGAFELQARFARLDAMDNAHDTIGVVGAGATQTDIMDTIIAQSANREEGGKAQEISAGVNWYPTPSVKIGLYYTAMNWKYDNGVVNLDSQNDLTYRRASVVMPSSITDASAP